MELEFSDCNILISTKYLMRVYHLWKGQPLSNSFGLRNFWLLQENDLNKKKPIYIKAKERTSHCIKKIEVEKKSLKAAKKSHEQHLKVVCVCVFLSNPLRISYWIDFMLDQMQK